MRECWWQQSDVSFWRALSVAATAIAVTSLAALVAFLAAQFASTSVIGHSWSALAVLRILGAPLFAAAFFLSGLLAPNRSSRIALFTAAFIDTAVFASYAALLWFQSTSY